MIISHFVNHDATSELSRNKFMHFCAKDMRVKYDEMVEFSIVYIETKIGMCVKYERLHLSN